MSEGNKRRRSSASTIEEARLLFFAYKPPKLIALDLNLKEENVWRWIRDNLWAEEREKLSREVVKEAFDRAAFNVAQDIITPSYQLIRNSLATRIKVAQEKGHWLNLNEMKALTDIVTQFTKLLKLEMGQPTEIVENIAPLSLEEIKRAIVDDQFVDMLPMRTVKEIKQ